MNDYDSILLNAIDIAHQAGQVLMRYFRGNSLDIHAKLNESDIVTVADKASEQVIIDCIHRLYPSHSILAEESGSQTHGTSFRWVIDPLDGTTNYSSGLPTFAISIGVEHNGERVVGVVFAPALNELFTAVKGQGAWLNGNPLHPKENDRIERAVISTGFPVDKGTNPDNNLDNFARVMPLVRGIRRLGSAALDLCYVAAGFLDAYWECNLHAWDAAAGLLIIDEAGAKWEYYREDRNISVIAASRPMFNALRPLIK